MKKVFKVGCFSMLGLFVVFFIIGLFSSEEENTPTHPLPSETTIVDSTAKPVEQAAEQTAPVEDSPLTTPRSKNRVAKELDWFETPDAQNLKMGDFIVVTGHPVAYIGAAVEPYGDRLFPTFKLTYREPCHYFSMEHWIYPAQGEISGVDISSEIDFTKIQAVRKYNRARQFSLENDDWLKHRGITIIVQIKDINYTKYNDEIGNLWSITAHYVPGDMLRY